MRTQENVVYLKDYEPPHYLIARVDLKIELGVCGKTKVGSELIIQRNLNAPEHAPLVLNGENMRLVAIEMDGEGMMPERYTLTAETLTIHEVPKCCVLKIEVEIDPNHNKSLRGLYILDSR